MSISLVALMQAAVLIGASTVANTELGFQFDVPDGFSLVELPQEEVLHAYSKSNDDDVNTLLVFARLHGVLDRTPLPDDLQTPDGTPVEIYEEDWREFTLQVTRVAVKTGDAPYVMLCVNVPLRPEAVQIRVEGTASREQELREVLHEALVSLHGETNWLTTHERFVRLGECLGAAFVAVTVAVIVFINWRKQRRRREMAPKVPPTERQE